MFTLSETAAAKIAHFMASTVEGRDPATPEGTFDVVKGRGTVTVTYSTDGTSITQPAS